MVSAVARRAKPPAEAPAKTRGQTPFRTPLQTPLRTMERRVYAPESDVPPPTVLHRNGIRVAPLRQTQTGTEYLILFDSLESRCKAWDRFNSDPAWLTICDQSNVRLHEIVIV